MAAGADGNFKALGSENNRSGDEARTRRLRTSGARLGLRIGSLAGRQRLVILDGTFPGGLGVFLQVAKSILLVVSALFPILDPIGGSPVFLSLTLNYDTKTLRLLARRIAINSFILLVASFTIGSHVLSFFGISLPVVQVGGGMIVVATGWAMLKEREENDRDTVGQTVSGTDILRDAFYPLTLPLTVGPGSISIAITLGK